MRIVAFFLALLAAAPACFADLTPEQKLADFYQLVGLYVKNYAPYEWKRDVLGYDAFALKPWLDKVNATKTDIDFWEVCTQYVAALQDSHDEYTLNSNFVAYMHFDVDIYDGKVLIDGVDRGYLSRVTYPFTIGDELISVDGIPVATLIDQYIPYAANGSANPSSRRRLAADYLTFRQQFFAPRAAETPASSTIVVKRAGGATESYTIKWDLRGTPLTTAGIVPNVHAADPEESSTVGLQRPKKPRAKSTETYRRHQGDSDATRTKAWGKQTIETDDTPAPAASPSYMKPLNELSYSAALTGPGDAFGGFGSIFPVFDPPSDFQIRLGLRSTDNFLSGTFKSGTKTVGFIRIPTMSPANTTTALTQFVTEILFFQANTDGLVIDVMRNGGGSLCYTEQLLAFLQTKTFYAANYYIRATDFWLTVFASSLQSAKDQAAPGWVIALYGAYVNDIQNSLKGNRAITGAMPICSYSADVIPSTSAYKKPIVVLTDEFTLSAAEFFSASLQDTGRATIVGQRTDGGGGNPASYQAGVYSEGSTRVTRTYVVRSKASQSPGFPSTNFIENAGVYPDSLLDFMTADNLNTGGVDFVTKLSKAVADAIAKGI